MRTYTGKKVVVVGAGLGGLSAASRLAGAGFHVTMLESQAAVGGKLQRIEEHGFRFDRGPSTITMPELFAAPFQAADRRMEDYLDMYRLDPATRNVFADGSVVDLTGSMEAMEEQIASYSPEDAGSFRSFMKEAGRLDALARSQFLNRLLLDWREKADPRLAAALMRVRPLTTLNKLLRRYFRHPNTLALFGRYATYIGSSPYQSPAIFAMLAQVEAVSGIYGVKGGTYRIAEALAQLAREQGADIRTSVKVNRIKVHAGRAAGVETDQGDFPADIVLANADVLSTYRWLLPEHERPSMSDRRIAGYEPSLSGFVMLLGVQRSYEQLLHHNVLFPGVYEEEFDSIFRRKQAPQDPAVYVCHPAYSEPDAAPSGGSSLFVLVNAPCLSAGWSWKENREAYAERVTGLLAARGICGLNEAKVKRLYTPDDLARDTGAYRGAIYGISSNTAAQTFFRPANRSRDIEGLWFVGGTTHPGGGTPIVTLSGQLVADRLIDLYGST
ncbi:phytoene desaturase [Paenibacillus sambharensis]|uniref:4,4'-diaponeurosporene oxygenase n=1 Tax=Paenibacillus sambharensis TaxID=1803190 RepID=A0A2W1LQH3_9BACL|nr:phytoene desaturase family protein [Paenibacillus sambharensis]PZD94081.1 phytoene desaturase [Paenibacillus sambharensis]